MIILFSVKVSEKHRTRLRENYPDINFIFCQNMDDAKKDLKRADVVVTYGNDLNARLIDEASQLKWIMVLSAGLEKMPFEAISQRGIMVTNARGIHKTPMAEYAFAMLLQVTRQVKQVIANEAERNWDRSVRMSELSGKTMLIAGTGAIGKEVARLAKAFRMNVNGVSRSGRPVENFDQTVKHDELGKLLPEADFLVSVLPSTKETNRFFTFDHFRKMPANAVFLNMGRGDAVEEDTILKAVREGEIAHAVLDVFDQEPLPEDHPFWTEDNITITPHISGVSPHYHRRALEIFDENLQTYLNGGTDYKNEIDLTRGY
ncbi:D-2-hydroxyacid dehydrogenase [Lentibacillus amyloliquefaciens]|uniref:3-phosphoglycerate dehydrogenase n=1 Tax=Lentibacillus amyloliquefaciens TaxID=1472767 RepID=A0A0U4FST1_9BACI|nr:D-2-hydroxyacid dehydrogenase [Lentibacillus amyloliquefaciens]ALX48949.1 3-phosphoglycerate dehydrogenase [Lentibacillus amyloliquefaciens]